MRLPVLEAGIHKGFPLDQFGKGGRYAMRLRDYLIVPRLIISW